MMKREQYKRIAAVPMIARLLLSITMLTAQPAQAAGEKQITLTCTQDETILTGMEWRLYRDGAAVSFIPGLADYSLDLGDLSAEAVDTAAKTLEGYITAAQLAPVAEGEIPVHYEVMIDRNMKQFLIRNTYKAPASVTTAAATAPPETVTTAVTKEPAKLIQTGQLWWPVVPLTLGGGLLIGAGLSARRKKRGDEA